LGKNRISRREDIKERNPILGKNRLSHCDEIKEIRFWGKIGFLTALILKKSDFLEKSDFSPR